MACIEKCQEHFSLSTVFFRWMAGPITEQSDQTIAFDLVGYSQFIIYQLQETFEQQTVYVFC